MEYFVDPESLPLRRLEPSLGRHSIIHRVDEVLLVQSEGVVSLLHFLVDKSAGPDSSDVIKLFVTDFDSLLVQFILDLSPPVRVLVLIDHSVDAVL